MIRSHLYERPRSGFQFSPIISNGWASSGKTSLETLFFPPCLSPLSSFVFLSLSLSFSLAVFSASRLPELFQSPTWEDLSSTPTFRDHRLRPAGITGRERGVPEEKGVLAEDGTRPEGRGRRGRKGFHFRDLWARRMHVTLRARCRFHRVISSYFTLSAAASFLGISVAKECAPTNNRFHSSNVHFLREIWIFFFTSLIQCVFVACHLDSCTFTWVNIHENNPPSYFLILV